jgi:hypothetical protein
MVTPRLEAIREGRLFIDVKYCSCGIDEGRDYGGRPYKEVSSAAIAVALALRVRELERELAHYKASEARAAKDANSPGVLVHRKAFHHSWYP